MHSVLRSFSNPGQVGLEPTTSGFGDRRSTIRATGLNSLFYFCFPVQRVFAVPLAVFHELELVLRRLAVLLGCIIATLALGALKGNNLYILLFLGCHGSQSFRGDPQSCTPG